MDIETRNLDALQDWHCKRIVMRRRLGCIIDYPDTRSPDLKRRGKLLLVKRAVRQAWLDERRA